MSGMTPFNWSEIERIFLASRPDACPYLPDRREQKLVTLLSTGDEQGFAALTEQGFRRSHDAAYRPACPTCSACKALRVRAADFRPNKTQRRLKRRYASLRLDIENPIVDTEHWALFKAYVAGRHAGGSMAHMTRQDFARMVADSPINTKLLAWRAPGPKEGNDGPLLAACLIDLLPTGVSAVYSYFSLDRAWPSLGTFVILALIELAVKADLAFVHLGYWVPGSATMAYKARFKPAEICIAGVWQALSISDPDA